MRKVANAVPMGYTVLLEMLTKQELMGTNLEIPGPDGKQEGVCPQGYVLAIGPGVDTKVWPIKVGSRVMLGGVGGYQPVPDYGDAKRKKHIVEMQFIKAILEEESILESN